MKEIHAALAVRERQFHQILEALPIGVTLINSEGKVSYTNSLGKRLFPTDYISDRKPEKQTAVWEIYQAGTNHLYQRDRLPWVRALAGETIAVDDIEIHQEGQALFLEMQAVPVWDDRGNIAGASLAFHEIGDRFASLCDRQPAEAALKASEARLNEVLDNTGAFISSVRLYPNQFWEYEYYSPGAEAIFGYTGAEFAADPNLWLSRIPSEDVESIVQPAFKEIYAGRKITVEYRFHHKNGSWHWISNTLSAKKHESGDYWIATGIALDITERKQAEKACTESEQRFAALAKASTVGIFRTDTQGNCLYGNDRCFEMIGLSQEESMGSGWTNTLYPEDRDRVFATWMSFVQQGTPFNCEYRFQRPDGSVIWVFGQAVAEKDTDGNIVGYVGTIADITERKQAEQILADYSRTLEIEVRERTTELVETNDRLEREIADRRQVEMQLRHSQQKLSAIVDNAGAYIYIKDLNSCFTYVNRLCLELFDLPEEEILGADDFQLFSREMALAVREIDRQIVESGTIHRSYDLGAVNSTGDFRHYLTVKVPLKHSDGSVYAICGISTDITELKQTEEALRQSQTLFKNAFETAAIGMGLVATDGQILAVNSSICQMFGYLEEELLSLNFQDITYPADLENDLTYYQQLIAGEMSSYDLEKRYFHKDGYVIWGLLSVSIVRDSQQQPIYSIAQVQDITARKQAEEKLYQAEQKYRNLIEQIPGVVYIAPVRKDSEMSYISPQLQQLLNIAPEEWNPGFFNSWSDYVHPEDRDRVLEAVETTLSTGAPLSIEYRMNTRDGRVIWVRDQANIALSNDGQTQVLQGLALDISDRKHAEAALAESEERYRSVVTAMVEGIVVQDRSGFIRTCNASAERILGLSKEQMMGRTSIDPGWQTIREDGSPFPGEEHPAMVTLRTGEPCSNVVMGVKKPEGSLSWISINSQPLLRLGEEVPYAVITSFSEITAHFEAQEALRQSEARYRAILEDQTELIVRFLPHGIVTFVNEAFWRYFGRSHEDIIGHHYQPNLVEEDRKYVAELLNTISLENPVVVVENRVISATGVRWTQWINRGIFDERGNMVEYQAVGRDISDRKQVEEALRKSEHFLQKVANAMPQILYLFDLTQRTSLYLNDQSTSVLGYAPDDICGAPPQWLMEHFHPDDRYLCSDVSDRFTHLGDNEVISTEYRFRHQNGEWRWLNAREVVFARDNQGIPTHVLGSVEDISDRKRAEAEIERAKEAAEAANLAKSTFLANMSHELRTPLNAILGFSQLMSSATNLSKEQQENLNIIRRSGEHLLSLINQVLDLSKVEAGRMSVNENSFDLHHLLVEVENMFLLKAKDKGLLLTIERTPDVPQYIQTDEIKLRQVLINLLGNAVKFTELGSVKLSVETANCKSLIPNNQEENVMNDRLATSPEGFAIAFKISDTGPGIAANEFESLFSPFAQARSGIQAHEGTGLGLNISYQFVRLMKGSIAVISHNRVYIPGIGFSESDDRITAIHQGTMFKVEIPIKVITPSEFDTKPQSRCAIALAPNQPRYRMLVVDDSDYNRQLLIKLLNRFDFELEQATNGVEALEMWQHFSPHLIWMDMRMPVMNGYEATQQIKATPQGRETVIIAITASAWEEEKTQVLTVGCNDFIRKPFQEEDIFNTISKHLGVSFIYEEATDAGYLVPADSHIWEPGDIAALPEQLVANLRQALIEGDLEQSEIFIEQVGLQNESLATGLLALANEYRFDKLLALIEKINS